MDIFFSSSIKQDVREKVREKLEETYGQQPVKCIWTYINNGGCVGEIPLYASENIVLRDIHLPLSQYLLSIHKGSKIIEYEDRTEIQGGYTYSRDGYAYQGDGLTISSEGVISYTIKINFMSELDLGMYFSIASYKENIKREIIQNLYSPLFILKDQLSGFVRFYPDELMENTISFPETGELETCLTGIYGETITLKLDKDFVFAMACKGDINGYPIMYYAPSGTAFVSEDVKLMPGLSGSEYISLKKDDKIIFCPLEKAYFDSKKIQASPTVSYLQMPSTHYYTQPQLSNYFHMENNKICSFMELEGMNMENAVIPVFPYNGGSYDNTSANEFENTCLAPLRHNRINEANMTAREFCKMDCSEIKYGITRQGMKAAVFGEKVQWIRIASPDGSDPGLAFTEIKQAFLMALLSRSLFLPLKKLGDYGSTPYTITEERLSAAAQKGYKDTKLLESLKGMTYLNKGEFTAALISKGAGVEDVIYEVCDSFLLNVAGWSFKLSPSLWEENNSLYLTKLDGNQSIADLAKTPEKWSLNYRQEDAVSIQRQIIELENQNKRIQDPMLDTILHKKEWCGTVFFSVAIDFVLIPEEIRFLINGIQKEKFSALYVAFPSAGLDDGAKSPADCLIYYESPQHLSYQDEREFGFKVNSLKLIIEKNTVKAFDAGVELLINRFFGARCTGYDSDAGNNILFNGSYQEDDMGSHYSFVMSTPRSYYIENSVFDKLIVSEAVLQTGSESWQFTLGGNVSLIQYPDMDIFSYELLPFKGFSISMKQEGEDYSFSFLTESFSVCQDSGKVRTDSLVAAFPFKAAGLIKVSGKGIEEYGFTPIKVKHSSDKESFGKDWYGIVWDMDTGNLGGLAGASGLTLKILTSWNQGWECEVQNTSSDILPIMVGVSIGTGGQTNDWNLPLQGVLSLGFDAIELHYNTDFYFRFRNFAVYVLGKRFPDTNNDMYLISDGKGNVGWYGTI